MTQTDPGPSGPKGRPPVELALAIGLAVVALFVAIRLVRRRAQSRLTAAGASPSVDAARLAQRNRE